MQHMTPDEP